MSRTATKPSDLRRMRESLNEGRGMTTQEVANAVAALLGEESRTGASIAMIENRGSDNIYVISALASIYGRTREEIAQAANPEKNTNILLQTA